MPKVPQDIGEYSASKNKYPPLIYQDNLCCGSSKKGSGSSKKNPGSSKKNSPLKFPPLRFDFEEEKRILQEENKKIKSNLTVPGKPLSSQKKHTKTTSSSEQKQKPKSNQKTGVASTSKNIRTISAQKKRKSFSKSKARKTLFNSQVTAALDEKHTHLPRPSQVKKNKSKTRKSINGNPKKDVNQELLQKDVSQELLQCDEELHLIETNNKDESLANLSDLEFLELEKKCDVPVSVNIHDKMQKDYLEFKNKQMANIQKFENLVVVMKRDTTEFLMKYQHNLKKLQTSNKSSPGKESLISTPSSKNSARGKENLKSTPHFYSPMKRVKSAAKSGILRDKILNRNYTKNLSQRGVNILKSECESSSSSIIQQQCLFLLETPSRN